MKLLSKLLFSLLLISSSCSILAPNTTCHRCSYYRFDGIVVHLADYDILAKKRISENEYLGRKTIYLQKDKTYSIYFKQCEPAIYDIMCDVFEIKDKKNKERIKLAGFTCKKQKEAYTTFKVSGSKEYEIQVLANKKAWVKINLGLASKN